MGAQTLRSSSAPPAETPEEPPRRKRLSKALIAVSIVVLVLGAGAGGAYVWFGRARAQPGPLEAARNVVVPHGAIEQVADALWAADVIANPSLLRLAVWATRHDGALHAAEFSFPAHASLNQVLAILRSAKPVEHLVTIPEGLTAHQIAAVLARTDVAVGPVERLDEGSVLPQTYEYEYGTARVAIVARAHAALERALAAAWAGRAPGLPLGSPRDALILASIVERETARPEERPLVAEVYLNRLRHGMRLQADPTVIYAASGGTGMLDHKLTRAELDQDDPFNTYRYPGLPPGPICAPGLAALQAVLHPANSDYLYFVADGSGGHVFAVTLEEHERNVAHWHDRSAAALPHGSPD